jgi:hypothetical protein
MTSPAEVESRHTLRTAVARYEELRSREVLDGLAADDVLELLALSEVIARKAGYGRQLSVRNARAAGASWTAIGRALGTTKQAAWEAHTRWIDTQSAQHRGSGHEGFDDAETAAARRLAGASDDVVP